MGGLKQMIEIGELDRMITIEVPVTVNNLYGETEVVRWSIEYAVPAKVQWGAGREVVTSDKETAFTTVRFTVRYIRGLSHTARVNYDGNIYDIVTIQELGRRRFQTIVTELRK